MKKRALVASKMFPFRLTHLYHSLPSTGTPCPGVLQALRLEASGPVKLFLSGTAVFLLGRGEHTKVFLSDVHSHPVFLMAKFRLNWTFSKLTLRKK